MSEIRGGQKATKMSEIQIETFETPWGGLSFKIQTI